MKVRSKGVVELASHLVIEGTYPSILKKSDLFGLGVQGYLMKPVSRRDLFSKIRELLDGS